MQLAALFASVNVDIEMSTSWFCPPFSIYNLFLYVTLLKTSTESRRFLLFPAFMDLVNSSNGNTQRGTDNGASQNQNSKRIKATQATRKGEKKNISIIPSHFVQTDVSGVKGDTSIFANMVFCILIFVALSESFISSLSLFYKLFAYWK